MSARTFSVRVRSASAAEAYHSDVRALTPGRGFITLRVPPGLSPQDYVDALLIGTGAPVRQVHPQVFASDLRALRDPAGPALHVELAPGEHAFLGTA